MKADQSTRFLLVLILFISAGILPACGAGEPEASPSPAVPEIEETATGEVQTPTIERPTSTAVPGRNRVILIAPPETEPELASELTEVFTELASSASLEFEVRPSFSPEELSPSIRLVSALPPDPGLAELAESAPQIQFLGISIPGLEPAHNLSLIDIQGISADKIGFLAGYLAALVTPEWRVGALTTSDTEEGLAHRQGFLNGAVFLCGLCRQTYPPFITYPLYAEAPSGSSPQEWLTLGGILVNQAVSSAYLAPGTDQDALIEYLAENEVNLVGVISPPPGFEDHWIATLSVDIPAAINTIWPDLVAGQGGASLAVPLSVTHVNPDLLSPGRLRLVENLISDLANGYIDTGVGSAPPPSE